jgi:DNA repair photolyase
MTEFKSFYKKVGGNEGSKCSYNERLDMYGCGCGHDCSYCYAKSLLEFRNLWDANNPKIADINKIKKIIPKLTKTIRLGGMTDCFQPLEQSEKVTYNTIKMLNEAEKSYLIVTKSDLVASDEYIEILDKNLAHIQISVTSTAADFSRNMERAVLPERRLKAVEKLTELGFDVTMRLSPFIPELQNVDILNNVKCDKVLVEFLRVNHWIKKWFDINYSLYTLKEGGYNHLPLSVKLEYLKLLKHKNISVCEDVTDHYEYFKNNFNPNKNDCCNLNF